MHTAMQHSTQPELSYTIESVHLSALEGEDQLILIADPIEWDGEMHILEADEVRWPVSRDTALTAQKHLGEKVSMALKTPWSPDGIAVTG